MPGATYAYDVSDDGSVVVGQATRPFEPPLSSPSLMHVAARMGDAASELQTFGDGVRDDGLRNSSAVAVSADGSVIAGWARHLGTTTLYEPALWTASGGAPIPLGSLTPGVSSYVTDMTRDGRVVIGSSGFQESATERPFRWTAETGMVPIEPGGLLDGYRAPAVSSDGETVVGYSPTGVGKPFRWSRQGGLQFLEGSNHSFTSVADVSGDGEIVVGRGSSGGLLWREELGTVSLKDLLTEMHGYDLSEWELIQPHAISEEGNVVAGVARGFDGSAGAFRAELDFSCITGPSKRDASQNDECSDLIEILTPTQGEFLKAYEPYEVTWRFGDDSDPSDSLIIAYSDFYDEEFGSVFAPTVIDTVAGDVEVYSMVVPNVSSKASAILVSRKSAPEQFYASGIFTLRGYDLVRSINDNYEAFRPSIHGWPFDNIRANLFPPTWYAHDQFDYSFGTDPFTGDDYEFPAFFATSEVFPDWPAFVRAFGFRFAYHSTASTPSGTRRSAMLHWRSEHLGTGWGGSCAGMSTTALMKFSDPVLFDSIGATVRTPAFLKELSDFDVSLLNSSATTGPEAFLVPTPREIINSRQNYWDGRAARIAANAGSKTDVRQLLAILKSFLLFDAAFYPSSYLYISNEGGSGAHAIVPYRLEQIADVDGGWRVYVYDPNHAMDDGKFVEIDSTLNAWRYSGFSSGTWGGGKGSIYMMDPVANYFDEAEYRKQRSGKTTVEEWLEIDVSVGASTTVRVASGQTMGFADGVVFDNLDDGFVDLPPVGGPVLPRGYIVPVGSEYWVEVSAFQDSIAYVQVSDAELLYNYSRRNAQSAETDHVLIDADGRLTIGNREPSAKEIRLMGVADRGAAEVLVDVDRLSLTGADSVRFSVEGEQQLRLHNLGSEKTYELHLELGTADGQTIFLSRDVPVAAGAIHHTAVDWNTFGTGPARINIDVDADGTIDSHLLLENEFVSVDVEDTGAAQLPTSFSLSQNYPNPFNPTTTISYALPTSASVELTVFDLLGREVHAMNEGSMPAGHHSVTFDATDLPSGVYFYRLEAGDFIESRSMVIVK